MEDDTDSLADEALPQGGLYQLGVNHSSTSIFEDVEMAQDEVRSRTM
jgi:hypothetical protein